MPPGTQLLSGIADKATNIRPHQGYSELVELHHADDGEVEVVPL